MSRMGPAVDVQNISVAIDGQPLLTDTTFTLDAGTCLAVRGDNGSGKTTLLRVLAGLQRPTTGMVHVMGRSVDERDAAFRRSVAGLIGAPPFARDLTVREHLRLVALAWGGTGVDADEAATQVLAELGLAHLQDRFVHQLSSGQTQLFALALTLVRPAEVLLLDEPEQRLDPERLQRVATALQRRHRDGTTIVMATHDPDLAAALADRTLTLAGAA
ncbi:ABC transporter ATP-binding protein [Ornithinimicrobium panacihumi]|uniref:ABC transporter ATP-binding protein n=1 Tax=Ornithinimicrobium panacihumi TaxID=2008449 RepID=UPI003F8C8859